MRAFSRKITWVLSVGVGLALLSGGGPVAASDQRVCARTLEVRNAIVAASGVATCAQVTLRHMREITSLDLAGESITSLHADDFDGLVRLDTLDLSGNVLTALPEGLFDGLYLLRTLRLDNNRLTTVPAGIFDQLWLLEELTLSGNPDLALADDLFGEFADLAGFQTNGTMPDNSGSYPRIQRFLDANEVTSPEGFIANLPSPHKQRFAMVYKSEAAARDHVSYDHPRFVSWGADGQFVFAWNTDPDAPVKFRESVEFLRQNEDDWTVGIIDFSGETPAIRTPASCQSCHGALNKPLWGLYNRWRGTEFVYLEHSDFKETVASTKRHIDSADPRIKPLDFDASKFSAGYGQRRLKEPGGDFLVTEAGSVFAWRHAEVLFNRLKAREDIRHLMQQAVCDSSPRSAKARVLEKFSNGDHNLALLSNTLQHIQGSPNLGATGDYDFSKDETIGGALVFLMVFDLWEKEPMVRKVYREVSNEGIVRPAHTQPDALLYYSSGHATAEDELIQKYRLHFGDGNSAALSARNRQNAKASFGNGFSSAFYAGHLEAMASRVCRAITTTVPKSLSVALVDDDAVLNWQAPDDVDGLTGYRLLRSVNGAPPAAYAGSIAASETAYRDESLVPGTNRYWVQALFDHYAGPESESVYLSVASEGGPTNLQATTTDQSVHLTWDLPVTGYIDDMYLERLDEEDQVEWGTTVASDLYGDEATSWAQSDYHFLAAGTTYRYRVKLETQEHGDLYSDVLTVTTQSEPPLPPTGLSATATHDTVSLSWTVPEQPAWVTESEPLDVMRSAFGVRPMQVDSVPWQQGVTEYSFTDTDVMPGLTYRYFIRSNMGAGLYYSDEVSVTTAAQPEDPDGTRGGATVLDADAASENLQEFLYLSLNRNGGDGVDYYTFTTTARYQLTFGVWRYGPHGNDRIHSGVALEDAEGNTIVESSPPPEGTPRETLETAIGPGTYYVRVEAMQDGLYGYFIYFGLETSPLTGFSLLDASTQTVLATLTDGAIVEVADLENGSYAIRADLAHGESVGSMKLELTGTKTVTKTENLAPYSLYGDNGEDALRGEALPEGSYTLSATAYSDSNLGGDELGTLEVSFIVTQATPPRPSAVRSTASR